MLVRAPYTISFVLAVCCWFTHNAAIPLASHSPITNKMQDAFKEKKTASQNNWDDMRSSEESSDVTFDSDSAETIQNMINNQNINRNTNTAIFNRGMRRRNARNKHRQQGRKESHIPTTTYKSLAGIKEEKSTNCSSGKKKNQRYSSSFENMTNHSLSVDKEFNEVLTRRVGNNSKVKTTSSVHEDEDITLCWIEITTIKEDKTVRPPKRLVIREYMISFENSAVIPDRYLECKKLEGELATNDPEIGQTALFEVIDENTKVSRVVNFTSIGHIGDIVVWQHKMVKCGVGPVVSKNIIELIDGSKNPKKRVEIKVSPKMHQLTGTEEPCTDSSESSKIEESSTRTDITTESCESGICEATTKSVDVPTEHIVSMTDEIVTESPMTSDESEENLSLSTGVSKPSVSSDEKILGSTVVPETPIPEILDCKEDSSDPACMIQKYTTPSSGEIELSTILIPIDREITTEEERLSVTTESSSEEKGEIIPDLVTEETTLFIPTTGISIESSEEHTLKPTDKTFVTDLGDVVTTLQTKITTSRSTMEDEKQEPSTSIEGSGSMSEELDKVDSFSSMSTTISEKVNERDTTTVGPQFSFTEFTGKSEKFGKIVNKQTESSAEVSAESINESIITEPWSTSEETSSEGSGKSVTSGIEEAKTTIEVKATPLSTIKPTDLSPTTSGMIDSCEDSEDCIYVSEICDEFGNCGKTTTEPCESGECSEEKIIKEQSTTKIRPSRKPVTIEIQDTTVADTAMTAREAENALMVNVPITTDTRRSTTTSRPRHKLTLKVKVLLEHVNENKEKHNLVEVERHLSLDENPEQHDHPILLEQLKSLNDSVNMETVNALLNCTSLGSLTRDPNFISRQSNDINGSHEELEFMNSGYEDSISGQSISGHVDAKSEELQYPEYEQDEAAFRRRRRRSLDDETEDPENVTSSIPFSTLSTLEPQDANLTTETVQPSTTTTIVLEEATSDIAHTENENITTTETIQSTIPSIKENVDNETKMEIVQQTLPGIQEDVIVGLQHVASQLAQNNLTSVSEVKEMTQTDLLGIIADPKNSKIRSRKRRAAAEEVGHWSNERIRKAPMGGNLRSLTEFTLYKVHP